MSEEIETIRIGAEKTHRVPLPLQDPDRLGILVLAFLMLATLGQALVPWFQAESWEVLRLRDDAWYEFTVARNVASGQGFTLDGVHEASGVQVLWPLVLAGLLALLGPDSLPGLAILLGTLLHLASAALVGMLALRFASRVVALAVAALFASRPLLVAEAMNGQETALALFVLLAWALAVLPRETRENASVGSGKAAMLLTLLLPWARTDLLLFPIGSLVLLLSAPLFGLPRQNSRGLLASTLGSLGLYVLLELWFFEQLIPVSGVAVPWLFHDAFFSKDPSFQAILAQYWWFLRPVLLGGPYAIAGAGFGIVLAWCVLGPLARLRRWLPLGLAMLALLAGARDLGAMFLASVLLLGTGRQHRDFGQRPEGQLLFGLCSGFVLLLFLHLPLRWYPRNYYFVVAAVPGVLGLTLLAREWLEGFGVLQLMIPLGRRLQVFWIGILVLGLSDLPIESRRFPWQAEMRLAARHVSDFVEEEHGIGAFNAGSLSWWYPGPIRNLDGVVDGAALPALKERSLLDWLGDEGMDYILDSPRQLADRDPDPHSAHASGRYLGRRDIEACLVFDIPGVAGEHPGTECQVLFGLPGGPRPAPPEEAQVLARGEHGVTVFLPLRKDADGREPRLLLAQDERERELRFSARAWDAGSVVSVFGGEHGSITRSGVVVLEW